MEQILVAHKLVDKCQQRALNVTKIRHKIKEKYSKGIISTAKSIQIHRTGFIAECAVCLFLGLDPYKEIDWSNGVDGGYDIKLKGITIDVKSSDNPRAKRLMFPVTKIKKLPEAADIFVMCRVLQGKKEPIGQVVDLIGWTHKEYFIRMHWKANGLHGIVDGTPYLNEKDLDDIKDLRQHIDTI